MNQEPVNSDRFPFLNVGFLQSRLSWSIHLRYIAAGGFFLGTILTKHLFNLHVPFSKIWMVLAFLVFLNTLYYIILKLFKDISLSNEIIFLHFQIIIDLTLLTILLHYSGSIDNPIFFFYAFHVVISSILFSKVVALLYSTFVVVQFTALIFFEYTGVIPHYPLYRESFYNNPLYIYLLLAVFIITVYVTAYICTTLMHLYRESKRKIDHLNEQLIEADRVKSNFFRFTSHELKSPIISIKTSIDGILGKFRDELDARAVDLLYRASLRAEQMLNILKELLELSRNRSFSKDESKGLEKVDVTHILKRVVAQETENAEQKSITINSSIHGLVPLIQGRNEDFEKIFRNLINNAIRYTPKGGSINIFAEYASFNFNIRIEDTGIGIADKDQQKIFDEFYRSENAKKIEKFGTGLGLSLVKQLVENYGGSIRVESALNKGTKFFIIIPVKVH